MNKTLIVYLVSLAAFLGPFTQTIYTPILPEVTKDFGTSSFLVNLTISIFTLFLALMQIVYGPLTDTKGRRKVLLFGIFIYVLASLGCFFSHSISILLVFRALQAIGIAAGSVVAATVIGDLFEGKARGKAMGTFQMMVSLGPVAGPIAGGFIGGSFNFHTVFLVLVFVGAVIFLFNFIFLKETKTETGSTERFQPRDFVFILKNHTGASIILLGFTQYYALYNFLVFLPNILNDRYALPAEQKGIVFLCMSLFIVVGSFVGGRIQGRFPSRNVIVTTAYLNVLAVFLFLLVSHIALPLLIVSIMLFGFFLGTSLPVQTTLLTQIFHSNRSTAIGVYNFFRYIGMACGPIIGSWLLKIGGYDTIYGFVDVLFLCCSLILMKQFGKAAYKPQ
ncbi:sugar (and other) transporter family protein [Anoxybacillus sp. B7M1]|jgi:MFS transporter, DHA1 family, multidrug resistance protein|uniref:MFS transporter n=1 Tax=Anoxybacteroides rupiense TaxID=311460 RepID=A0ABD5J0E4_9BACL|nr:MULTISPECIES: MFS transporter [Anoxybacillus]ANB57149.1 sugar (and other) transporter family protein [Anoxybacillus sp. B2M1]ANB64921.1 sugar (and other) transporter family protein [Anoxybacillus sp. B7M1]KXG09689.1 Bacillibactin exporter [Anoxybacillus sp. P3H1B]MBS2772818.1 MFS transporter [Anoxybacillus rupiensis]MDE8565313.1 MFS transporter [Anoxybacillus rupiensis]